MGRSKTGLGQGLAIIMIIPFIPLKIGRSMFKFEC